MVYGCTRERVSIDGEYSGKIFDTDLSVVPGDLYTMALTRPRVTCRRYTLIHLRDTALYAWTQVDTSSVRTPEEHQTFQQLTCSTGRATSNPHIPSGVHFCHLNQYRLPCASIYIYRVITLQRVSRRVVT